MASPFCLSDIKSLTHLHPLWECRPTGYDQTLPLVDLHCIRVGRLFVRGQGVGWVWGFETTNILYYDSIIWSITLSRERSDIVIYSSC